MKQVVQYFNAGVPQGSIYVRRASQARTRPGVHALGRIAGEGGAYLRHQRQRAEQLGSLARVGEDGNAGEIGRNGRDADASAGVRAGALERKAAQPAACGVQGEPAGAPAQRRRTQDPDAGAAPTLSSRFTHPRGAGSARELGLGGGQVDDIADFIENGLFDPAFATFDLRSSVAEETFRPSTFFQLSPIDFTYSTYRPDRPT